MFEVRVEERHTETVEEIHHAYRDIFYEVVYRVEAEDAADAEENYQLGERSQGPPQEGDYYDSEYVESGSVVHSQYEEEEVLDVLDEDRIPCPPRPQPQPSRAVWRIGGTATTGGYYTPQPPPQPSWEV
jgi:hypothetical protein